MTMTVKKLISELEKIENKFLEVECHVGESFYGYQPIERIKKVNKKIVIFTKDDNE
ncbi:TPA: hypothetical protein ACPSKZ_000672 [Legionella anisa]|uniref:hypothetical protein n=1 Tax=Legionella anisa TaxID=28082 RepID=UPI002244BD4A|nr:hypothetical protein [Legionella anisa]MCW8425630.1 hypothetical protein [Legionella anisa]MCW8448941.1 hypothetical protein [Legionella anisa]